MSAAKTEADSARLISLAATAVVTAALTIGMAIGTSLTAIEFALFFNRAGTRRYDAQAGFARTFHLSDSRHWNYLNQDQRHHNI